MYDISTLNYEIYLFDTGELPGAPYISINIRTDSTESITAAVDAYLSSDGHSGAAAEYRDAILSSLLIRDELVTRFEKDVMDAVGLASIDPIANTYVANKKANEVFAEAGRNISKNSTANLRTIGQNAARLKTNIFTEDEGDGLIYEENESPVAYDGFAVTVGAEIGGRADRVFISQNPNATGTDRYWYSYDETGNPSAPYEAAYAVRYDGDLGEWIVVSTEAGSSPVLHASTIEGLSEGAASDSGEPEASESSSSNGSEEPGISDSSSSNGEPEEPGISDSSSSNGAEEP